MQMQVFHLPFHLYWMEIIPCCLTVNKSVMEFLLYV